MGAGETQSSFPGLRIRSESGFFYLPVPHQRQKIRKAPRAKYGLIVLRSLAGLTSRGWPYYTRIRNTLEDGAYGAEVSGAVVRPDE